MKARDLALRQITPYDSATLTEVLHERGVNVRYLGKLASTTAALEGRINVAPVLVRLLVVVFDQNLTD